MTDYILGLDASTPTEFDPVSEGAGEIRGIKTALRNTFPYANSALDVSNESINQLVNESVPNILERLDELEGPAAGGNVIVASCKYNGSEQKYGHRITSVSNGWNGDEGLLAGQYRVNFDTNIPEFDEHYAVQITPFPAFVNGVAAYPVIVALQGFTANAVTFTVHQIGGPENGSAPQNAVGFSLMVVDIEQS
jgi:hypothetical protein